MKNDAGRRRKFGKQRLSERVVFYVTEEQREAIDQKSEGDASSYIRNAVLQAMSESRQASADLMAAVRDPNDPLGDDINKQIDGNADIQNAAKKYLQNTISFPLSQPIHERLTALANEVGYAEPSQLAKDLAMAAAKDEVKAKEFLFGDIQKAAFAAAQEREAETKNEAKSVKKKVA